LDDIFAFDDSAEQAEAHKPLDSIVANSKGVIFL